MARKTKQATSKQKVKRNPGTGELTAPEASHPNSMEAPAAPTEEQEELELLALKQELEKMYQNSWVNNEELKGAMKNTSF